MNNILTRPEGRLAKAQIVQMLDAMCQAIEPTETQYNDATERYKTIGEFLAEENSPLHCFHPFVYPQGSLRIRAAIRPAHGKVFDVDVCCEFRKIPTTIRRRLNNSFGSDSIIVTGIAIWRLKKNRCVRIQYAGDFHMDVMPCVPGQPGWSKQAHVWVPDKKLDNWKPSHPVGFAAFVEKAAAKSPKQLIALSNRAEAKAANVEPLTAEQSFTKPALIRIIQILKRHRDQFFQDNHDMSPISVIITTLVTHSYDRSVSQNTFDSVYDLMLEVVSGMPEFIKVNKQTAQFFVENPTHPEENFAEKWNENPELPKWFFVWHRKVTAEINALAEQEAQGLDKIGTALANSFGSVAANQAIRALSASVKESTATGKTGVTAAGLVVPASFGIQTASKNPAHNFHGS